MELRLFIASLIVGMPWGLLSAADLTSADHRFIQIMEFKSSDGTFYPTSDEWAAAAHLFLKTEFSDDKLLKQTALDQGLLNPVSVIDGNSEALSKSSEALYLAYREFREKSPKSKWFVKERLPTRIDSVARDLKASSYLVGKKMGAIVVPLVCPPPVDPKKDQAVDQILKSSKLLSTAGSTLAKNIVDSPEAIAELTGQDWKKDWTTDRAKAFVQYLDSKGIFLKESDLAVMSRAENGLIPATPGMVKMEKVEFLVVHHTAGRQDYDLKGGQLDHMNRLVNPRDPSKGTWSDFGAHYLLGVKNGTWRMQEGRLPWFKGAHAAPPAEVFNPLLRMPNSNSIGIETAGLYTDEPPPPEALIYIYSLAKVLKDENSDLVKRMNAEGVKVDLKGVKGHLECSGKGHTVCPGAAYLPVIQEIDRLMFSNAPAQAEIKVREPIQ